MSGQDITEQITMAALTPYLGLPYCARTHDCADLVMQVMLGLFGRCVVLPQDRPRPLGAHRQQRELGRVVSTQTQRIDTPRNGDLVLMIELGATRPSHAGVYFFLGHEHRVLHNSEGLGSSRLHRIAELPRLGLNVEGYYRWI